MKFLKYFSVYAYLKAHEGDHDENGEPVMADKCNAEMLETGMCRGMFPQWTFDINSGKVQFREIKIRITRSVLWTWNLKNDLENHGDHTVNLPRTL